jgi:hypothetical protein
MIECGNCHRGAHDVQRSIYTAQSHPSDKPADRILSPMFVTHVECTGCHVEHTAEGSGMADTLGTVAKATPEACDNCHRKETGQRYIPFWQEKVKNLYGQVSDKAESLEQRARLQGDQQAAEHLYEKVRQARSVLETVSNDGSWGVHNFKYTEAILRKANAILEE